VKAKHQWLSPEEPPTTEEVAGSGYFIDNDSLEWDLKHSKHLHLVTNAHVAMDAIRLTIRLPATGLLPIKASVVGLSPPDEHDIALLRVDDVDELLATLKRKTGKDEIASALTRLPLGDSDDVHSGAQLMALGYPEGLPGVKSTLGVMSGYQEMSRKLYMQMTTPINPGNSGGPLLSLSGQVIGMNTAGITGSESIGFAIPMAIIKAVLPVLSTHRVYERPVFGIVMDPTASGMNELFGEDDLPEKATGQYISQVYKGSIAAKAGMKVGDVVYEFGGMPVSRRGQMFLKPIHTFVSLDGWLGRIPLGTDVECKVWRDGKSVELHLKYANLAPLAIPLIVEGGLHKQDYEIRGGLVFSPLTQNFVKTMSTPIDVGSSAEIPSAHMLKFAEYPDNNEASKVVIADVIASSLAEATKVFTAAMVVDEVNKRKVATMDDLCTALEHPVEDHNGKLWLTIKTDEGEFSAMPVKDVDAGDKKLIELDMIRNRGNACSDRKTDVKEEDKEEDEHHDDEKDHDDENDHDDEKVPEKGFGHMPPTGAQ